MSRKKYFDFSKPEDVEEAHRLIFEDNEPVGNTLDLDDDFDESETSDLDDHVETRSVDSDTDHDPQRQPLKTKAHGRGRATGRGSETGAVRRPLSNVKQLLHTSSNSAAMLQRYCCYQPRERGCLPRATALVGQS
ncbi:hypothetical protein FQR65_LT16641 [Abscondita terminalis]|nr:hypothetical protein FQR65_LT16641 [Abscondita terminalis]